MEGAHQHELEGRRLPAHGDGVPDRGGVPPGAGAPGAPRRGGGGAAVVEAVPLPPGARAGRRPRRLRLRRRLRARPPPPHQPSRRRRRRRRSRAACEPERRAERGDRVPWHAAARPHHPARRRGRAPPARLEQPPRLGQAAPRRAGAARHRRPVRLRERLHLRPLPRRRIRAPGRPRACRDLVVDVVAAPPAPDAAGVARVPPLQRALPVAAQGRAVRGQDGRLPPQGRPVQRRHRGEVAREGAPPRGLRQLRTRVHQAREQQEVRVNGDQIESPELLAVDFQPSRTKLYLCESPVHDRSSVITL